MKFLARLFGRGGGAEGADTDTGKAAMAAAEMGESSREATVDRRIGEARRKLIDITRHVSVIAQNRGDPTGEVAALSDATCTLIERVLQNFKTDPDDLTRAGLALEALEPVVTLVAGCAKAASLGNESVVKEAVPLVLSALRATNARFKKLREGALQIDDRIELQGLELAASRLFTST